MINSLRVFWWRSEAIEKKQNVDYSGPYGPIVLVVALCVSITFSGRTSRKIKPRWWTYARAKTTERTAHGETVSLTK